ncbi:hypothetical protein [Leeuwenhoekiella parthenopeia]|uniref:Uncharacterized protein n=1 Tax=Leeuwenhoekiella parthenopeia TaxID=2890320 RepID=A0ABS8GSD0_9FLAO|nr:hypothetical protein [Leeuwenhoekiella parthenopeia]MCC4212696.1 hypothetical protein [Leeuwenhoekiella parthenopeia]
MKRIVFGLMLVFFSLNTVAQVQHYEVKPQHIEKAADSLTQIYSAKLGMTPKQDLLFKSSLEDFLLLREEVSQKKSGKAKLEDLTRVYVEESSKMSEILTEYQFELYEKIKPGIQPVDTVEKD